MEKNLTFNEEGGRLYPTASSLTLHATERLDARRISRQAIFTVLDFGREVHTRGAIIHVIGRKEVKQYRRLGLDLSDFEGIHAVCSQDGAILTVYRNHNLRSLRPFVRARAH
jgi:hypothetical protein